MQTYNLYNDFVEGDYVYSVDMITLSLTSFYSSGKYMLERVVDFIGDNFTRLDYERTFSHYAFRYANFFTIKCGTSVIKIWIGWNGTGKTDYKVGKLQFNPNKVCGNEIFDKFFDFVRCCCLEIKLKMWDFAIDIKRSRDEFKLHKDQRKYQYLKSNGVTEQLGCHNEDGFFKLYDKGIESHVGEKLTRCELTVEKVFRYDEMLSKFPDVDIYVRQLDMSAGLELSQNDFTFLRLLLASDDFDYFYNQLTYRKREKFKPYLFQNELKVVPSKKGYKHCCEFVYSFLKFRGIRRYSNYYVSNDSKQVSKHYRIKKLPEKIVFDSKPLTVDEVEKLFGIKRDDE